MLLISCSDSMFRKKNKDQEESTAKHDGTDNTAEDKKKGKFYKRFAQQELWGWSPIITGNVVVIYFLLVAVVCIALGVPILVASIQVKEVKARYDNTGSMSGRTSGEAETLLLAGNVNYPVSMQIPQTMQPPVSFQCLHYNLLWLGQAKQQAITALVWLLASQHVGQHAIHQILAHR